MMQYRGPAPARDEPLVTLGPLPARGLHFVAPALLLLMAAPVGACSLAAAVVPPERETLRCARAADTITCEVWSGARRLRRFDGPMGSLELWRTGGHHPERCLKLREQVACSPSAEQHVARVRALADGQSVDLDATKSRSWISVVVGALFAGMLLVMAASQVHRALGRRKRVTVFVRPYDLVLTSAPAAPPIPRARWEVVRVARLGRPGRGEYPRAVIEYGDGESFVPLGTWMAFDPRELEPFAASLRHTLARFPRAGA